nr:PAS domain S-box protein [Desulfobacula sp.]
MADLSRRTPGLWFLVHTFYAQTAMLAGSFFLLQTARRQARPYRHQAIFLSLSAIIPVLISATALFNLLPKGSFNPTIPGLAMGAGLAAVAILRFDFLKKPLASGKVPAQPAELRERRVQVLLALIFGLSGIGIISAGYLSYTNFRQDFRKQIDDQLSAIADLKLDSLQEWRTERLGDAEVLHQSPAFAALVKTYLENPKDGQTKGMLQVWLDSLCRAYDYDRVFFMDTQGHERLFSPNIPESPDPHLIRDGAAALDQGRVALVDFHQNTARTAVYLSLLAPVYEKGDLGRPLGLVVFRIDPEKKLYPYLKQWPTPSRSAETLLARRDGDSILFLHQLRFHPAKALTLRIPLTETEVLAVKAALGQSGTLEGKDYRGRPVIGNVRAVPDSPWLLVARMDRDEIQAPLRKRLWQTFLFFTALMVFPGAGLILALRQQRMRYYQDQVKTLEALHNSEEKFRLAFETSPDSVAITRLKDGLFVFVNPSFESILGYPPEEVIGRSSFDIDIWDDPRDRQNFVSALQAKGKIENFEALFHGKNGPAAMASCQPPSFIWMVNPIF